MDLLYDIGHGPKRICTIRFNQGPSSGYPGGYLWISVLEHPPGEDVGGIKNQLSGEQLYSIRKQLAYILKWPMEMRQWANNIQPFCDMIGRLTNCELSPVLRR